MASSSSELSHVDVNSASDSDDDSEIFYDSEKHDALHVERKNDDDRDDETFDTMEQMWGMLQTNFSVDSKNAWRQSARALSHASSQHYDADHSTTNGNTETTEGGAAHVDNDENIDSQTPPHVPDVAWEIVERLNRARLQRILSQRKKDFFDRLSAIRIKYHGRTAQMTTRLSQEQRRVSEMFSSLFQEEKARIKTSLTALVRQRAHAMNVAIDDKLDAMQDHFDQPTMIQSTDKIAFFCGVVMLCVIEAIILRFPRHMPQFYLYTIFPLMLIRYLKYHQLKYHYFLLDFCYFTHAYLIYFLWWAPTDVTTFQALFALSNGSLMCAIVLWKNSIVFHSLDKVTSSYIHILPALVTYSVRWFSPPILLATTSESTTAYTLVRYVLYPLMMYGIWQAGYLVKTEILDREKLDNDQHIDTSLRHLQRVYVKTGLYRFANAFGPTYVPLMFALLQLMYTFVTILPTYWMYNHHTFHAISITIICAISVWNGANYYVYKFAKHQSLALAAVKPTHESESTTSRGRPLEDLVEPRDSTTASRRSETWYQTWIRRGKGGEGSHYLDE